MLDDTWSLDVEPGRRERVARVCEARRDRGRDPRRG